MTSLVGSYRYRLSANYSVAGHYSAAFAIVLWSAGAVIIAYLEMPGTQISFWRMTLGGVAYTTIFYGSGRRLTWTEFRIAAPAAALFSVQLAVAFVAVQTTTVANFTTITALVPLVLMATSSVRYRETIPRGTIFSAVVAIAGIAIIMRGSNGGSGSTNFRGDLLAILGMLLFSAYFVMVKKVRVHLETFTLQTVTMIMGPFILLPVAAVDAGHLLLPLPEWSQFAWIALVVAVPGTGHLMMNWAHLHISLTTSGLLTLGIPVLSTLGAWLVLDQSLSAIQIVGMTVVLGSLVAVVLRAATKPVNGHRAD